MPLRTATEPLFLDLELRYGFYPDPLTPPVAYSREINFTSLSSTPAEQNTIRVPGRTISTLGTSLLSIRRPTGTPAQIELKTTSFDPGLLALALGGEVAQVNQSAGGKVSTLGTMAQGIWTPLPGRYFDAASFVVGTGDGLTTGVEGSNTGLTWSALEPGDSEITVSLSDPAGNDQALGVTVVGTDIDVSLATDGSGTLTSTAAEVLAAVNADAAAAALVAVSHTGASTGAGVVAAVAQTDLTGGSVVDPSAYEVDAEGGYVMALTSAAVGAQRIYAELAAVTLDRYEGGAAVSQYTHLTGMARSAATGKTGRIDIWQAVLSSTAPLVAPQDDSAFEATFAGDGAVPAVAIDGITPTRPIQFDDRRA